jgi:hypothetical protein
MTILDKFGNGRPVVYAAGHGIVNRGPGREQGKHIFAVAVQNSVYVVFSRLLR